MFCSKCGAPLPDNAAFCPKCGANVASIKPREETALADSAETVVKVTPQLSVESDAAFKYKSKLCFFLAFFPLMLTGLVGGMTGTMVIFWINLAIAVPLYVAGWFFLVKRHGFGFGATVGVTALFSFIGAYLVPIIPICAWHVWHLRKILPEKRPPVNDHIILAILSQLGVVPCVLVGIRILGQGSNFHSWEVMAVGLLFLLCALPGSWALKNSKKVTLHDFNLQNEKNAAEHTAEKAKWLAILGFVLPLVAFAAFLWVTSSMASNEATRIAEMKGRHLFVLMISANTERESRGLVPVWPHRSEEDGLDPSAKDDDPITAFRFPNTDLYFAVLLDSKHMGEPGWKPYVECGNDKESIQKLVGALCLADDEFKLGWMIAEGLTVDMPDSVPVLVSANVDPKRLVMRYGRELTKECIPIGKEAGRDGLVGAWGSKFVVIVRKSGKAETIPASDFSLWRFYDGVVPEKRIEYLDVQ